MPDDLPGARGLAGLHTWNKSTPFRARQDSGRVFSSYLKTKMRQRIRNAVCLKKTIPLVTDGRSARTRFDIVSKHPPRGRSSAEDAGRDSGVQIVRTLECRFAHPGASE